MWMFYILFSVNNNGPGDYGMLEKHPVLGSLRLDDFSIKLGFL